MQRAAFASKVFGLNAMVAGLPLVVVPDLVLTLLGLPAGDVVWTRLWGMEVVVLGFYYLAAGRADARPFFAASVWGRFGFTLALVGLFVLQVLPWQALIIGAFDSLGAVWTALALRQDARAIAVEPSAG